MNTTFLSKFIAPTARRMPRGLILAIFPLLAAGIFSVPMRAQDAAPPADSANGPGPGNGPGNGYGNGNGNGFGNNNGNGNADGNGRRGRGNFSPEAQLDALRTRFGITDDAEWNVISQRVTAVMELQRSVAGGRIRGAGGGGGGGGGGVRSTGNPEMDALRGALTDNMPDAEIKARLERLREVRKENEAKLEKARADLLAVLTVKQEAVAVMMNLLP